MKKILLFGAGKSATVLIDYLLSEAAENRWTVIIADANREIILEKTNYSDLVEAVELDINNDAERAKLIRQADIVISMMPPSLHFFIARDCVEFGKNLLTASYVDPLIESLRQRIEEKKLLFLCEMGLDPGIDHMSAMKLLDEIREKGGTVTSFKSHCGGLVAPESDNNPWHYKISWNPRNVVMAGKAGAEYKLNNEVLHKSYSELFKNCTEVNIEEVGKLACYPNRDSLSYMPVYKLGNAETFLRTTLRYSAFCVAWDAIVAADLANDLELLDTKKLTFKEWSSPIHSFINDSNLAQLTYLGLFDDEPVPEKAISSADILQFLLEKKLAMQPDDKDMIVMLHEIEYILAGSTHKIESSLVVKGADSMRTAMAKTVGLPLGIAAKLILNGRIQLSGIHIPTSKAIYEPVLKELALAGINFTEKIKD
ncbi:MAG: saccharopine dehydrogenase C-terminal domain-containing protein [Ferruginibacter sp.]